MTLLSTPTDYIVGICSFVLGCILSFLYMKWKASRSLSANLSTVLIFPDDHEPCKHLLNCLVKWKPSKWHNHFAPTTYDSRQQPSGGLQPHAVIAARLPEEILASGLKFQCRVNHCQFYHFLDTPSAHILLCIASAESQLDICMYSFTDRTHIVHMLAALQSQRQIAIRVIVDAGQSSDANSAVTELQRANIPVVALSVVGFLMHHKVCIVDNKLAICGSMNWSKNAFGGNYENAVVSRDPNIVGPLITEFDRMWQMCRQDVFIV